MIEIGKKVQTTPDGWWRETRGSKGYANWKLRLGLRTELSFKA